MSTPKTTSKSQRTTIHNNNMPVFKQQTQDLHPSCGKQSRNSMLPDQDFSLLTGGTKPISEPKHLKKDDKHRDFPKKLKKKALRSQSPDTRRIQIHYKKILNVDVNEHKDSDNHLQVHKTPKDNTSAYLDSSMGSLILQIRNTGQSTNDIVSKMEKNDEKLLNKINTLSNQVQTLNNQLGVSNEKEYKRKKVTIIFFFSSFLACLIWILTVVVFKLFKAPFLPKLMERKIHQIFTGLSFGLFLESTWTPGDIVEAALFLKYEKSDKKCKNTSTRWCYIGGWFVFFITLITNYFGAF